MAFWWLPLTHQNFEVYFYIVGMPDQDAVFSYNNIIYNNLLKKDETGGIAATTRSISNDAEPGRITGTMCYKCDRPNHMVKDC